MAPFLGSLRFKLVAVGALALVLVALAAGPAFPYAT
jgi:hypothetical protein